MRICAVSNPGSIYEYSFSGSSDQRAVDDLVDDRGVVDEEKNVTRLAENGTNRENRVAVDLHHSGSTSKNGA